ARHRDRVDAVRHHDRRAGAREGRRRRSHLHRRVIGERTMSRVAKKPIALPKGVECKVANDAVTVKGPKGTLHFAAPRGAEIGVKATQVQFKAADATDTKMAGTARALLANMVKGVTEGYQRKLELVGVGYRATLQGKDLNLTLGFSHPIVFKAPEGI